MSRLFFIIIIYFSKGINSYNFAINRIKFLQPNSRKYSVITDANSDLFSNSGFNNIKILSENDDRKEQSSTASKNTIIVTCSLYFRKIMEAIIIGCCVLSLDLSQNGMKSENIFSVQSVIADDELARFAAEGNKVSVDGQCFFKKCALETSACANNPSCLKGLSCLARCKGGSLCSTGCFAKYGSDQLDNLLSCSVEKNDCVQVPGKEANGWTMDKPENLPSKPLSSFDISTLKGTWYKAMGLDSRYDCFDCQKNSFEIKNKDTLKMEALFRIPRPNFPGYLQNRIVEELHTPDIKKDNTNDENKIVIPHMQSKGQMFGLTFWENWYLLSESTPTSTSSSFIPNVFAAGSAESDMKLIFYTGHTLQGSYKGAFLYSRAREMTPELLKRGSEIIRKAGLDPNDFCIIRNQCFLSDNNNNNALLGSIRKGVDNTFPSANTNNNNNENYPFWYFGQQFFDATKSVAEELADWFGDPAIVSDWLISQQERMVFTQPLQVSPFASLPNSLESEDL